MKTGTRSRILAVALVGILVASIFFAAVPKNSYIAYAKEDMNNENMNTQQGAEDGGGGGAGQPGADVMKVKMGQATQILTKPGLNEEVYLAALDELMQALYMSNLVVLPTKGVAETNSFFDVFTEMAASAEQALSTHINNADIGTGKSKAAAVDARDFIQANMEAMRVIAVETNNCDPNNPTGPGCDKIKQFDETGAVDNVAKGFFRDVRSPFFIWGRLPTRAPQEQVIVPQPLKQGECVPIVKETKGVKLVVRAVKIPIWVEPWFARARIVGFKIVWIWEFLPAEFLKTLTYCNNGKEVTKKVDTELIVERQLTDFWKFLPKDP